MSSPRTNRPRMKTLAFATLCIASTAATGALASAHAELTAAEDQWLTLEMRREEIEGG